MAFPADALDVAVEIFYDGVWNDITTDVFDRDGNNSITITRGRGNEDGRCTAGHAAMKLNNANGKYSPRKPESVLFGKIGRNTLIRISYTHSAVTYVRFVGEITAWPSRWDPSGSDVWVDLHAWGILRRLGQGGRVRSALHRTILGDNAVAPVAYWPMEDGTAATRFASAFSDQALLNFRGSPAPGSVGDSAGSLPYADFIGTATLTTSGFNPVSVIIGTGYLQISFVLRATAVDGQNMGWDAITVNLSGSSTFANQIYCTVLNRWNSTVHDEYGITWGDPPDRASTASTGFNPFDGSDHAITLIARQSGSDIVYEIWVDGSNTGAQMTYTDTGGTLGTVRSIDGPKARDISWGGGFGTTNNTGAHLAIGHLAVHDTDGDLEPDTFYQASIGWAGEQAHERVERVGAEETISVQIVGSQSALMGPQRAAVTIDILEDCATTDRGFLFEQRQANGAAFRCNSSRYNQ